MNERIGQLRGLFARDESGQQGNYAAELAPWRNEITQATQQIVQILSSPYPQIGLLPTQEARMHALNVAQHIGMTASADFLPVFLDHVLTKPLPQEAITNLVVTLHHRDEVSKRVGTVKRKHGKPIRDSERERLVIEDAVNFAKRNNPGMDNAASEIYIAEAVRMAIDRSCVIQESL